MLRETSCPRGESEGHSTCSSPWVAESVPQSARRCGERYPRFLPWTGPERGSRKPSVESEYVLCQSRQFLSKILSGAAVLTNHPAALPHVGLWVRNFTGPQ